MELFEWLGKYAVDIIGYLGMIIVIASYCFKDIKTLRLVASAGSALCSMYGFITQTYPTAFLNLILLLLNISLLVANRIKRQKEKERK